MLNKKELLDVRGTMATSGRHIVNLVNCGREDLAFLEFDNMRNVYGAIGLGVEYKDYIKYMLSKKVDDFNELFFSSFCASYVDYRSGDISVARIEEFRK